MVHKYNKILDNKGHAENPFEQAAKQIKAFASKQLPAIVGVEATKHFKESFQNEGFTDEALTKWPDITDRRKDQKRRKNGDLPPILTETGDLGDSLTWSKEAGNVVVSTDAPYAQRHNEGTNGMPERRFMGPSKQLEQKIVGKIEKELGKIFNRTGGPAL